MNRRLRKKIWICNDVWVDILPFFERVELGLTLALISPRFDALVDTHFDGKSELTLSSWIMISKDKGPKSKLSVRIDDKFVVFPFPDRPLHNKIRFKQLQIFYIDHSVITFLRFNKQIWDRMGTKLELNISDITVANHSIWEFFARKIWPIFATSIRHLTCYDHLDILRRHISSTILTDLDQLNSICSYGLFPDAIAADDEPNATVGQALSKWLHTPSKNGQPKRLFCKGFTANIDWINGFKEAFLRATASVNYKIRLELYDSTQIVPFELMSERTQEKLTLEKMSRYGDGDWLLKRCPIIIGETAAAVQWENDQNLDANLNFVQFNLWRGNNTIRPLSPPAEEKEKADE